MASALECPLDEFDIMSPERYAREGYPHAYWDRLRRESPIHRLDYDGIPYWAVTRHADITTVGRQPDLFLNEPMLVINSRGDDAPEGRPRTLIEQDNPRHRQSRRLISNRFTPRAMKSMHADIERIARKIVDDLLEEEHDEGEYRSVDFVDRVSAPLPIAVIAWMLGVPESDWLKLYEWTNKLIGFDDPEFGGGDAATATERRNQTNAELFGYFASLVDARRSDPQDDLISLFAHAEIDGKKLELIDVLAWCQIIVVAGNETTRNATSGGILAFIEHPDELRKLQNDMSLLKPAVEEIVRWSSPIIHFARTAAADTELSGVRIRKGDHLALFYPSANRDDAVFEDPYAFRVDRRPNRHIGFGVGEHFCAGAHVARLELELAYKSLLPRIQSIELAGDVDRLQSNLVGGIKRLPVRYKLKSA